MKNCVIIGDRSFADGDNQVIIGDNIRGTDDKQPNVLILGGRVVIGRTLFGVPINLKDLIEKFITASADTTDIGNNTLSVGFLRDGTVERSEIPRYQPKAKP